MALFGISVKREESLRQGNKLLGFLTLSLIWELHY